MSRLVYVIPIVLIAFVVAYYGLYVSPGVPMTSITDPSNGGQQTDGSGATKEFTVSGHSFGFDPSTIEVKKGDVVKITFISDDISHNLYIEGYNIGTNIISKGESSTVQFTANMAGTYAFYCTVFGHKDAGMVGTLIVDG